ncbi:asparaginase [candidate division KSB1 bacterium]|nr:asparaginase [candidate division KSB1 bacterium]
MSVLLANLTRGDVIESQHYGHIVVVEGLSGKTIFSRGAPHFITYIRSAAKAFQAMPLYEDAVPEIFNLTEAEMAVIMASHNGEERHVNAVSEILRKSGCKESDLQCGVHVPLGAAVATLMSVSGVKPTMLHNNCSGKHAGMLAACINRGLSIHNYLDFDHPHQQRVLQTVQQWAELPEERMQRGIDGCSAPNFALPLYNMANMYAKLMASQEDIPKRIVLTYARNPEMIAGEGRFDTDIMRVTRGRILAKVGAEGIQCLGIDVPTPMGMAVKIVDGSARAVPAIVIAVLEKLELLSPSEIEQLSSYRNVVLRNHRGLEVGKIQTAIEN